MLFPDYRPRRLRKNESFRRMIRETTLSVDNLIYPLFVVPGQGVRRPIVSMPGVFQLSVDELVKEAQEVLAARIPAIILFGIPDKKDERASGAYAAEGIIQRAVKALKDKAPDLMVIGDVCLCEYMSHGHCGLIRQGEVDNDATLELLARTALSQVKAGADMVAPSDMMDGRVAEIRQALDENGFEHIPIMAYSAKYCLGLLRSLSGGRRIGPPVRRPKILSDGSPQRAGGDPGGQLGYGGRGGHPDGQTGPGLPGCDCQGPGGV